VNFLRAVWTFVGIVVLLMLGANPEQWVRDEADL